MYSTLVIDTDVYDNFQDISSREKRIVRVGTKTFDKTGTYITVKLYKKNEDGVFKRRYTSKRSVRPEKNCAESDDENDADDEYSNNKKCRVA